MKLRNLQEVVRAADEQGFPIIVGTEMNSAGQKFIDDFNSAELAPLLPAFLKGARIAYAHSALQRAGGIGYMSPWAASHFKKVRDKNAFFEEVGARLEPVREIVLKGIDSRSKPGEIITLTKN